MNLVLIIFAVIICLFIFFILFVAIIYKIATKEGGWMDLGANSYYENRDTGARGSFRRKILSQDGATYDVKYSPLNNPFKECTDPDIPVANITDEISGFVDKPGVQNRYVIVTAGKDGECRMEEAIGKDLNKKSAILSKKLSSQVLQTRVMKTSRDDATKSLDEQLMKMTDRKQRGNQEGGSGNYGWPYNRRERDYYDY